MEINKNIESIIIEPLKKLDFHYLGYDGEWKFIRKSSGFNEYISLDQSQWQDNVIRVYFSNGEKSVSAKRLIGEEANVWFEFHDEKSLEKILLIILDITEELGLKWFKENVPKITFSPFLVEILDGKHQEKINVFFRQNFLKIDDPNSLIHAESFLLKNSDEKAIAQISYFFGELIIYTLQGKWDIDEFGVPILIHIGGKEGMKKNPYKIVSRFLDNPKLNDLIGHYNILKNLVTQ